MDLNDITNLDKLLNLDASAISEIFSEAGIPNNDVNASLYNNVLNPLVGSIFNTRVKPLIQLSKDFLVLKDLFNDIKSPFNLADLTDEQKQAIKSLGKLKGIYPKPGIPTSYMLKVYLSDSILNTLDTTTITKHITFTTPNSHTLTGTVLLNKASTFMDSGGSYVWVQLFSDSIISDYVVGDSIKNLDPDMFSSNIVVDVVTGTTQEDEMNYLMRVLQSNQSYSNKDQLTTVVSTLYSNYVGTKVAVLGDKTIYRVPVIAESNPDNLSSIVDITIPVKPEYLTVYTLSTPIQPISDYISQNNITVMDGLVPFAKATLAGASHVYKTVLQPDGTVKYCDTGSDFCTEVGGDPTLPKLSDVIYHYINFTDSSSIETPLQTTLTNAMAQINAASQSTASLLDGTVTMNRGVIDYLQGMLPGMPFAYRISDTGMSTGYIYKLDLSQYPGSFLGIVNVSSNGNLLMPEVDYMILSEDKSKTFEILPDGSEKTELYIFVRGTNKFTSNPTISFDIVMRRDNNMLYEWLHKSGISWVGSDIRLYSPIPVFEKDGVALVQYPTGGQVASSNVISNLVTEQYSTGLIPGYYQAIDVSQLSS
jgi:hypothetical protein